MARGAVSGVKQCHVWSRSAVWKLEADKWTLECYKWILCLGLVGFGWHLWWIKALNEMCWLEEMWGGWSNVCHVWSRHAFWKLQAGKEPKDSLKSRAACWLVLPLDKPHMVRWAWHLRWLSHELNIVRYRRYRYRKVWGIRWTR